MVHCKIIKKNTCSLSVLKGSKVEQTWIKPDNKGTVSMKMWV